MKNLNTLVEDMRQTEDTMSLQLLTQFDFDYTQGPATLTPITQGYTVTLPSGANFDILERENESELIFDLGGLKIHAPVSGYNANMLRNLLIREK